jgi:hypothetical protein
MSNQRGYSPILLTIAFLVIALGAYYLGKYAQPISNTIPTEQVSSSSELNSTSTEWKDYQIFDNSVKIPANFNIRISNVVSFTPEKFPDTLAGGTTIERLVKLVDPNTKTLDFLETNFNKDFRSYDGCCVFREDKIGDMPVVRMSTKWDPDLKSSIAFVRVVNHLYIFSYNTGGGEGGVRHPSESKNYEIYEKIISSFTPLHENF